MCNFNKSILVFAVLLCLPLPLAAQQGPTSLLINELMASNANAVASPDYKEYADWLEIYNPEDAPVLLDGCCLTDDLDELDKWPLPEGTLLPAKGYLLVWADDRNSGLHANFKLSSEGEHLALTWQGAIVDSLSYPAQLADFSYGRVPDGSNHWFYLSRFTPAAANSSSGYLGIAEAPRFSLQGGFHSAPQQVMLFNDQGMEHIYYTRDGSIPTEQSTLYTGALTIDTTTVIRARILRPGSLPSKVSTRTFLINESISLPVVSVATDPANLWDDQIGIYVIGANGIKGYCSSEPRNWNQPWEQPVSVEMWEADGNPGFILDGGMQIGGGCTRLYPQKPLAFYTRAEYGTNELEYKLFADKPMTRYNNFLLRNGGQDWWRAMFRDGMMHTLVKDCMDIDWLAYKPAVLFLNGVYWGIHDIREKHNEHYIAGNHGIDPDLIDILADNASVEQGSAALYTEIIRFIESNDLSMLAHYEWIKARIDIDEYLNYQIAEIYFANIDWPGGNIEYWRQQGEGHRWRWILFDTDLGFGAHERGQYDSNTLENATTTTGTYYANPAWSTFLFRSLLKNPGFRDEFIQRFAAHLNTTFASQRVLRIIDSLKCQIEPEMPRHIARWPKSTSFNSGWSYHLQVMNEFAVKRPDYVRQHLSAKFGLKGQLRLLLDQNIAQGGAILAAGVRVPAGTSGHYFAGVPVLLRAVPNRGYRFAGWQGAMNALKDSVVITLSADDTLTALFVRDESGIQAGLRFNEVMALNNRTKADEYGEYDDWLELYNGTSEAVDIGGMYVSDNISKPVKWQIPASAPQRTTIPPAGYLLLWADNSPTQGVLHLNIKLSGDGEEIILSRQGPAGLVIVDTLVFGPQSPDISWGRSPDGVGKWTAFAKPTPGSANTSTGTGEIQASPPVQCRLLQNYPNPFNARTTVIYELDRAGEVRIAIYDISGREVRLLARGHEAAGHHETYFDAEGLPSGIYLCRLSTPAGEWNRKMLLVR